MKSRRHPLRRSLLCAALAVAPLMALPVAAHADTSGKTVALSNNYAGNSWRQLMLASWQQTTDKAVKDGLIKSADTFTTAENQATEQAAQIQKVSDQLRAQAAPRVVAND